MLHLKLSLGASKFIEPALLNALYHDSLLLYECSRLKKKFE